jgi:hypothetical protein
MSWQKVWERIESRDWVRIWNIGTASAKELLVYGGQSEGKDTGYFHTGAKQTADALTELGTEFVIVSSDKKGPYALTFRTYIPDGEEEEIVGREMIATVHRPGSESEDINLMRTSYAGYNMTRPVGDDDNVHFKSVCQLLINAAEAANANGHEEEYGIDIGPGGCHNVGHTQVFVDVNSDMRDIVNCFGFYFKSEAKNLKSMVGGKWLIMGESFRWWNDTDGNGNYRVDIWETANDSNSYSLYMQVGDGVGGLAYLVAYKEVDVSKSANRYNQVNSGIGDYVVVTNSGHLLNSDRTISDINSANNLFAASWGKCKNVEDIGKFLLSASDPRYIEHWFPVWSLRDPELWKEAFEITFPYGAISDDKPNVNQYAIDSGYTILELGTGLSSKLKEAGAKTAEKAAGYVDDGLRVREPTSFELKYMQEAEALLRMIGCAAQNVTYEVIYESTTRVEGRANQGKRIIRIWHEVLEDGVTPRLLECMAHEHRHIISDADDNTHAFTHAADKAIAGIALMVKNGRLKAA